MGGPRKPREYGPEPKVSFYTRDYEKAAGFFDYSTEEVRAVLLAFQASCSDTMNAKEFYDIILSAEFWPFGAWKTLVPGKVCTVRMVYYMTVYARERGLIGATDNLDATSTPLVMRRAVEETGLTPESQPKRIPDERAETHDQITDNLK